MQRQYRLKRRAAFAYVYRKGEKAATKDLLLLSAPSREGLKIGISVSKKVGNAVTRNHVKRYIREALNQIFDDISRKSMYVLVVRPSLAERSFGEVSEQVRTVFEKAGRLKKC